VLSLENDENFFFVLLKMYWSLAALVVAISAGKAFSQSCPGYTASNVTTTPTSLTAQLKLAGTACNQYGDDIDDLVLNVEYQTGGYSCIIPFMT
jgi:hypothetical protein